MPIAEATTQQDTLANHLDDSAKVTVAENVVLKEIFDSLYSTIPSSTLSSLLLGAVLLYTESSVVSAVNLITWASILTGAYLMRHFTMSIRRKKFLAHDEPKTNLIIFRSLTFLCGLAWGSSQVFMFSADIKNQFFLFVLFIGLSSASIIAYSADKLSIHAYILGILMFAIPCSLLRHNEFSMSLAIAYIVFIIYLILASSSKTKGFRENITLRLQAQKSKAEIVVMAQRQQLHMEHTPLAVIEWNSDFVITFWNAAASDIFGYSKEEAIGQKAELIISNTQQATMQNAMQELILNIGGLHISAENIRKDGQTIYCEWFNTILKDSQGEIIGIASLIQDQTSYIKARKEVERLAYTDALTELPNRRLLLDKIEQAIVRCKSKNKHATLMFIDLDNFKILNDTHGHAIGDLLLLSVAKRLKKSLRTIDTVSRIGGDEFVVLIEDLSEDSNIAYIDSVKIVEKILKEINKPFKIKKNLHYCSPSIGVCLFAGDKLNVDQLLKFADSAMYQAKQSGKNNYRFYDESIQESIESRAKLKTALQQALANNQFYLHFQPKVNSNKNITGAEVLLRWNIPERGNISPAEFIPLAEETSLIIPIGNWVMLQACQQLKKWELSALCNNIQLSINVSAIQFYQDNFIESVRYVLDQTGCNPNLLTFELTETAIIHNFEDVIDKFNELKLMGIALSMDDFGIGYSSLSVLKRLPLDELKVDQSFVNDLPDNKDSAIIVQTIIAMGNSLGLNVIAEGVETKEQMDFLSNACCHNYQGYLFSKPIDISSFETLISCNTFIEEI